MSSVSSNLLQPSVELSMDPSLLHQSYYLMALSRAIDTRLWIRKRYSFLPKKPAKY